MQHAVQKPKDIARPAPPLEDCTPPSLPQQLIVPGRLSLLLPLGCLWAQWSEAPTEGFKTWLHLDQKEWLQTLKIMSFYSKNVTCAIDADPLQSLGRISGSM